MQQHTFEYYYTKYWGGLVYFSYRILQDKESAQDCVANVFAKFHETNMLQKLYDRYKVGIEKVVKAWLYTCVRNATLNEFNRQKKFYKTHENENSASDIEEENVIINHIIAAEVTREIHQIISQLPRECQKVFTSLFIEGKKAKDIAKELGLSISTVKNQKGRGLALIKSIISDSDFPYLQMT